MSDLDKDIELVSNLKNIELKGKVNEQYIYTKIPEEYLNAIENVLKELEELRDFSTETVRRNAELQEELETWKKIAEKLADILSDKMLETLGIKPRIEDLIECARNEVLKVKMETTRPATRIELAQRVDELQEKLEKKDKELETHKKIAEKLAEELSKHIWLNDKDAILKIYREKVEEDETYS